MAAFSSVQHEPNEFVMASLLACQCHRPHRQWCLCCLTMHHAVGLLSRELREDLPGIQYPVRIEGRLDPFHELEGLARQLDADVGRLREADAVLPADRAFELHHALEQ